MKFSHLRPRLPRWGGTVRVGVQPAMNAMQCKDDGRRRAELLGRAMETVAVRAATPEFDETRALRTNPTLTSLPLSSPPVQQVIFNVILKNRYLSSL